MTDQQWEGLGKELKSIKPDQGDLMVGL